jgi:hypothetical protein
MHDDILSYHAYMLMFLLAKFAHMTLQFTFWGVDQLARAFFGEALKVVILFTEPLHFMEKTLAIKLVKHGATCTFCEVLSVVCRHACQMSLAQNMSFLTATGQIHTLCKLAVCGGKFPSFSKQSLSFGIHQLNATTLGDNHVWLELSKNSLYHGETPRVACFGPFPSCRNPFCDTLNY